MNIHSQPITGCTNANSSTSNASTANTSNTTRSDNSTPSKNNNLLPGPDLVVSSVGNEHHPLRTPSPPINATTDSERGRLAAALSYLFPSAAGRIERLNPHWRSNPIEHPAHTAEPFYQFPHTMFDYYHTLSAERQIEIRQMESGKPPNFCQRCMVDTKVGPNGTTLSHGTLFRFSADYTPKQLAALFFDYNHHHIFVPGMTRTHVVEWRGKQAIVNHDINPTNFVIPGLQFLLRKLDMRELYALTAYPYQLQEEVFVENLNGLENESAYTIRWAIPATTPANNGSNNGSPKGSREYGEIRFEPFINENNLAGTLITYNNATGMDRFSGIMWFVEYVYNLFGTSCNPIEQRTQDYYERTVSQFLDRADQLPPESLTQRVAIMENRLSMHG